MNNTNPPSLEDNWPILTTIKLMGGKYKSLILWHLLNGSMRFSALSRAIPCATAKMLTQQLRELENDGLISRQIYAQVPPKVEYSLTELGQSLQPVLAILLQWGHDYLQNNHPNHP